MCNAWNHPSWCRCGFGGEGYRGSGNQSGHPNLFDHARTRRWRTDDFCIRRPCPKCGKNTVYFISYNGGSVWVNNLGPPWEKHPCFVVTNQTSDPFQLLLFDPPAENPILAIIVQATLDSSNTRLHMEVKCETGEMASLECDVTGPVDCLEGSLIFVYRMCRQVRLAQLGTLRATRLQFASAESPSEACPSTTALPPPEAGVEPEPGSTPANRLPKRLLNSLNWTDDELTDQDQQIIETVKAATAHIANDSQANKEAKRLAREKIENLPRTLRNLLLHRFECDKWQQVLRKALPPPG